MKPDPYYLFACLIKDGCEWHGDTISAKWIEALHIPPGLEHQVKETLRDYKEGVEYKLEKHTVFIAAAPR